MQPATTSLGLQPTNTRTQCGSSLHRIAWSNEGLALHDHAPTSLADEETLFALGNHGPECVAIWIGWHRIGAVLGVMAASLTNRASIAGASDSALTQDLRRLSLVAPYEPPPPSTVRAVLRLPDPMVRRLVAESALRLESLWHDVGHDIRVQLTDSLLWLVREETRSAVESCLITTRQEVGRSLRLTGSHAELPLRWVYETWAAKWGPAG